MKISQPSPGRLLVEEEGQAAVETAWLLAALVLGAAGLGWPLFEALLSAWWDHRDAVQFVIESPFP